MFLFSRGCNEGAPKGSIADTADPVTASLAGQMASCRLGEEKENTAVLVGESAEPKS